MRLTNAIKSDPSDDKLLFCDEKNKIYYMFELVGIHEAFLQETIRENFNKYYVKKHNTSEYHYRNMGVQTIYRQMVTQKGGFIKYKQGNTYNMSKRKMRIYGVTHRGHRVCVCLGWDEVTFSLNEYINNYEEVKNIYEQYIKEIGDEAAKYMTFQNDCINTYCDLVNPTNRQRKYIAMREYIQQSLHKLNL